MDVADTLTEIASLSVEDRINLVQAIWDTVAAEPGGVTLSEAQRQELQRRLAAHAARPQDVVSWEQVRASALARARP